MNQQITIQKSKTRIYFLIPALVLGLAVLLTGLFQSINDTARTGIWLLVVVLGLYIALTCLWAIRRTQGGLTVNGTVLREWSAWPLGGRHTGTIDLACLTKVGLPISFNDYRHITKVNGLRGTYGAEPLGLWDDAGQVYGLDLSFYSRADRLKLLPVLTEAFLKPGIETRLSAIKVNFYSWFGRQATESINWPAQNSSSAPS